jgi:CRP/FNR family cyclic AMP-dependent transcriptional regulator
LAGSDTELEVQETYARQLEAGDTVFEEGAEGQAVFVIVSGEIEVSRLGAAGRKVVARLGPGEFFGEMSVIVGGRRTGRAVAVVPTRLLELDAETFEKMCIDRPEVAIRVIRLLTTRLIDAEKRLAKLGIDDLMRPLVRVLVDNAIPDAGGVRIKTTLRELAHESGLSMMEAHRALHQLFDRKALRLVGAELVASGVESLTACLDSPS